MQNRSLYQRSNSISAQQPLRKLPMNYFYQYKGKKNPGTILPNDLPPRSHSHCFKNFELQNQSSPQTKKKKLRQARLMTQQELKKFTSTRGKTVKHQALKEIDNVAQSYNFLMIRIKQELSKDKENVQSRNSTFRYRDNPIIKRSYLAKH